jgi:hypothetical protein
MTARGFKDFDRDFTQSSSLWEGSTIYLKREKKLSVLFSIPAFNLITIHNNVNVRQLATGNVDGNKIKINIIDFSYLEDKFNLRFSFRLGHIFSEY